MLSFLKHRVIEYLDSSAAELSDPSPPPPAPLAPKAPPDTRAQVVFTGFPSVQRTALERRADAAGLRVVKSVTRDLMFLCGGPNAGPSKLAAARAQGVFILTKPQLIGLCDTGEIPEDDDVC